MYKKLLVVIGATLLLAFTTKGIPNIPEVPKVAHARWEGTTDMDMLHQVQKDLNQAIKDNIEVLQVELSSPGGPVIIGLLIAKTIRDAEEKQGLVVEIHASMLCTSMCTFILASGSPKHRFIDQEILVLVHSMQEQGEDGEYKCVVAASKLITQEEKANATLFSLMRTAYMRYTGHSLADVTEWTTCGKELVGKGDLAVQLNMADRTV